MKLHAAAFSERGAELALRIARAFGGAAWAPEKYAKNGVLPFGASLGEWTGARFAEAEALVFVSSCGIAVRAVAPHLRGKDKDPAVIVADERGLNVISLLSGHLGGANELALRVAGIVGGRPVITTATDVNGITPPDSYPVTLWLRPKDLIVGVGCKRGTEPELLREYFSDFMKESGYSALSAAAVASIEQKRDEAAIAGLAEFYNIPFETFSAKELMALPGEFTPSPAALAAVGADNVCERAAIAASRGGYMVRLKTKYPGVTFALARKRSL